MELRERNLNDLSALRRRIVELELENKRLRATREHVTCGQCKYCVAHDGIFHRCLKRQLHVVATTDYCSGGKLRNGGTSP